MTPPYEPLEGHTVAFLDDDDQGVTLGCECGKEFSRATSVKARDAHGHHVGIIRARTALTPKGEHG